MTADEGPDGLPCGPSDETGRALWGPAYAAGREHGHTQALTAVRLSPVQRRLADLRSDKPWIEPEASEVAFGRFVATVGSAPLRLGTLGAGACLLDRV